MGNLDSRRDWGFAGDYVEGMWRMLQQDAGDDYVLATGETHSVREFAELAFSSVGLEYEKYLVIDSNLYRPTEANPLVGDTAKALTRLSWRPRTAFAELVKEMVEADCKLLRG